MHPTAAHTHPPLPTHKPALTASQQCCRVQCPVCGCGGPCRAAMNPYMHLRRVEIPSLMCVDYIYYIVQSKAEWLLLCVLLGGPGAWLGIRDSVQGTAAWVQYSRVHLHGPCACAWPYALGSINLMHTTATCSAGHDMHSKLYWTWGKKGPAHNTRADLMRPARLPPTRAHGTCADGLP